jgi:hypothetical protein
MNSLLEKNYVERRPGPFNGETREPGRCLSIVGFSPVTFQRLIGLILIIRHKHGSVSHSY